MVPKNYKFFFLYTQTEISLIDYGDHYMHLLDKRAEKMLIKMAVNLKITLKKSLHPEHGKIFYIKSHEKSTS